MKSAHAVIRLPNPMMAVVWLAIFTPGHLYEWWVERTLVASVFVLSCLTLFLKSSAWESRQTTRRIGAFFFLIQFFYMFSFIYSVAFNGIETGPRDYFDLGRHVFLWAFVAYVYNHYDERVRGATEAATTFSIYYCLIVAFCFLKFVPVLTPFFRYALYAQTKTAINYMGQLRLSAPFENPNFLGFYMMQVLCYLIFFSRSTLRFLHCAGALLVIYFSGSRTTWAATTLILSAAFAAYAYAGVRTLKLKLAVQLSLGVLVLVLAGVRFAPVVLQNNRVRALFEAVHKGGVQNEANAAGRLEQNLQVWDFVKRSPLLGWGPSKYAIFDYVDDQYALWGLRNGAIGTLIILAGLGWVAARLILSQRGDALATTGSVAFVSAIALALLTGEFLGNFRLFYMTWFIGTAIARRPR
jgi:O-antigen ligase